MDYWTLKRNEGQISSGHRELATQLGQLSQYFQYTEPIRKIIYSTNVVEGFHWQVHKVTKTRGVFTSDMALINLVYLATKNIQKKWTSPLHN